jgi:UDP:flavonoid glycosyltransferase YjiC (YdhE family)
MFAGVAAPAKVADLVAIIADWHPDIVVHDAIDFAAPVAAAHGGLPWASHSFGALQPEEFWSLSAQLVAPTWKQWGLEAATDGGMFRYLYLDICPPSFQASNIAGVAVAHLLRPVPFSPSGRERPPEWLSSLPERPTVYVTMGTIFNEIPGVFEVVLDALGDAPFNVVATVGRDRDPAELGPMPANVHVERWISQSLLLAHCDVVVCHGGSGTTLAALAHGLPLLLLPQGANQFENAQRCVELGVARVLPTTDLDRGSVARAVESLLGQPGYRDRAGRIRTEIGRMPDPSDVVPLIEALATDRKPLPG